MIWLNNSASNLCVPVSIYGNFPLLHLVKIAVVNTNIVDHEVHLIFFFQGAGTTPYAQAVTSLMLMLFVLQLNT